MSCIHGHPLVDGGDVCEQGHAGGAPPAAAAAPATLAELQQIIQQILTIQNNSLQSQLGVPTTTRSDRSKAKPDRPTIKQNSTDSEWELFLDS